MSGFTKGNVLMVINKKEIKLLYEEANRGKIFGLVILYLKLFNKLYEVINFVNIEL